MTIESGPGVWRPVGKGTLACLKVGGPVGGGAATPLDGCDRVEAEHRAEDRGRQVASEGHQGGGPGGPVGDVTGGQASTEGRGGDVGTGQVAGEQPASTRVHGSALGSGAVGEGGQQVGQGGGERDRGPAQSEERRPVSGGQGGGGQCSDPGEVLAEQQEDRAGSPCCPRTVDHTSSPRESLAEKYASTSSGAQSQG